MNLNYALAYGECAPRTPCRSQSPPLHVLERANSRSHLEFTPGVHTSLRQQTARAARSTASCWRAFYHRSCSTFACEKPFVGGRRPWESVADSSSVRSHWNRRDPKAVLAGWHWLKLGHLLYLHAPRHNSTLAHASSNTRLIKLPWLKWEAWGFKFGFVTVPSLSWLQDF